MSDSKKSKADKVFVALDNMDEAARDKFMTELGPAPVSIKLGLEFFSQLGPEGIRAFHKKYNKDIFFDYKLHDIPNTVSKAIKSLEGLPIKFLTIHATGGRQMIRAAMDAKKKYLPHTKILGVSYLTSLGQSDFNELWNLEGSQEDFLKIFKIALEENIDGLVLSPHELSTLIEIERELGKSVIKVTPAIRFSGQDAGDQKRVATPKSAFKDGADYLVMGRALTEAKDLQERLAQI